MSESVVTVNLGELKFVSESVSSCNICYKTFFDENELDWLIRKRHTMRVGWPDFPFKCKSEFDNQLNQMHMIRCDLCGAAYIRESELKDHIEEHHRSSPKPPV